jgi:hypothetical protein
VVRADARGDDADRADGLTSSPAQQTRLKA